MYCGGLTDDRVLIQTMPVIGQWIGALIGGYLSDLKGRKVAMLVGLLALSVSCVSQYFGGSLNFIPLMILGELMSGVAVNMVTYTSLILLTRFFSKSFYEVATVIWFVGL